MFAVGDVVMCLSDFRSGAGVPENPRSGKLYTVRSIFAGEYYQLGRIGLRFVEIQAPKCLDGEERGWDSRFFRKVIDHREAMEKAEKLKKNVPYQLSQSADEWAEEFLGVFFR